MDLQISRLDRERDFWDVAVPDLDELLAEYHNGPDPNTSLMFDKLAPLGGRTVLDFACGGGTTSCWLADRGAVVTGVDLSPASVGAARKLAAAVGADVTFIASDIENLKLPDGGFDAVAGRWALHHLDVAHMAPILARCLAPDGRGAFAETMGLNPILRFARARVAGRFGVARYGTDDEHPLQHADINALRRSFASVSLTQAEYTFLSIFDRQVLRYRWPTASRLARAVDRALASTPGTRRWSFHQVIVLDKSPRRITR